MLSSTATTTKLYPAYDQLGRQAIMQARFALLPEICMAGLITYDDDILDAQMHPLQVLGESH